MIHPKTRTIISLGGSLFIPDAIDTAFIAAFKNIIEERVKLGESFVIIVGGGKICRRYQQAGRDLANLSQEDQDWIGIHVTRLNAQFMRIIFGDLAHKNVVTDPSELVVSEEPVVLGAGWEPSWSTDYDAVMMAHTSGAKRVINLSNTNYVYDKDPNKFPDAKAFTELTWEQYRSMIPSEWEPGLSTPFDPIASKMAQVSDLEVVIMNGTKLGEVQKCLRQEAFDGTTIRG